MNTPSRRVLQLDVLRGIAILLVIGRHLEIPRPGGVVGFLSQIWYRIGWLGVDLFFVLSGFLIGGLLLTEYGMRGKVDIPRFLVRRGLKIYPPYFVFITYLILMPTAKALLGHGDASTAFLGEWASYWPNLLFLQNYVGSNPAGHTWTLAVEEHFYLMLPFALVAVIALKRTRWLVPSCFFVVPALVLAMRCLSVWTDDPFAVKMSATHLRLDALLFGVGLRGATQYFPERFAAARHWRRELVALGILLWLPNCFVDPATAFIRTVGLTLTLLGAAAFLVAAYHTHARDFQRSLRWVSPLTSLVAGIGVYSYAIYLWHVTAMGILEREVGRRVLGFAHASPSLGWLVSALAITIGAIVVGMLAGRVVEWPVLRLRDRFFPSRSGGLSLPGTNVQSSVEPKERKAAVAV